MKNIFLFLLVLSFYNCTTALNLRKYDNVKTSIASLKLIGTEGRKNIIQKFNVEKMCFSTYSEYKKLIN